MLQVLQRFKLT